MTEILVNAINLKSKDYKENDKLLTLFTYEKGLIFTGIKGVKKAQAKLKFAAEPFCFGEYRLNISKNKNFNVIGCEYKELFYPLREDIIKYTAAFAMAEYCILFVQNEQPDTDLFAFLIKSLTALCYDNIKPENILLKFLINALNISGYNIGFNKCCKCGKIIDKKVYYNFLEGGFCCGCNSEGFKQIPMAVYKTMKFIANSKIDRLSTIKTDLKNILHAIKMLNAFILDITGKKIESLKNLESFF